MEDLVLITGATGYVGGELLKKLEEQNARIRCMVRNPKKLRHLVRHTTEVVHGDALEKDSLVKALDGVTVAYYLIHSMKSGDFSKLDRQAAENFAEAASETGVKRIIYLGGLSQTRESLSDHMKSRHEVGEILSQSGVQVIEFRASVVIGSGSLSFEMIRALTERLPVMVTPKWVSVKAQPISIDDVLSYLIKAKDLKIEGNAIFEIGGKDRVSYKEIMKEYGKQRGLKRLMISVPVLTPKLSSLWLSLFTPLYAKVGKKLIESIYCESVVHSERAKEVFHIDPMGISEAIQSALSKEDREYSNTAWLDAHSSKALRDHWGGVLIQGRIFDTRHENLDVSPEEAFAAIERIGGSNGWYYGDWLWTARGAIDRLFGGVGMRRGRPHPHHLKEGDELDFWRVEVVEKNKRLRLRAEMKVPGRAWLEFIVEPEHKKTRIRQTAIYDPKGVLGLFYWYAMYPLHGFIFAGMLRGIAHSAKHQHKNDHTFQKRTHLNVSAADAFRWHENPGVFERLTPPWEDVIVLEKTDGLQDGAIVKLRMKVGPFRKVWIARHYGYVKGKQFCDEQVKGPFAKWQHEHLFHPKTDQSCVLEDHITFRLPYGDLGEKTVRKKLERLFQYRHEVTEHDLDVWKNTGTWKVGLYGPSNYIKSALQNFFLSGGHEVVTSLQDGLDVMIEMNHEVKITVNEKRLIYGRLGEVLSPKGGLLKQTFAPKGNKLLNWIAIDDFLYALVHIIKTESLEGAVDITSPHPVTYDEFTKELGKVLKKTGQQKPSLHPQKLLDSGFTFRYPKLKKALEHMRLY